MCFQVPLEACSRPMEQDTQHPRNDSITDGCDNVYSEGERLDRIHPPLPRLVRDRTHSEFLQLSECVESEPEGS